MIDRLARVTTLVACAALTLSAGCGSSTSGTSQSTNAAPAPSATATLSAAAHSDHAGGPPDACYVLSKKIAKLALGPTAHLQHHAQPNPHESQCQYATADGAITVMVGPWSYIGGETKTGQTVHGIGEQSYVGPMGLVARRGDRGIDLDIILGSGVFIGKAADDLEDRQENVEERVAPALLRRL